MKFMEATNGLGERRSGLLSTFFSCVLICAVLCQSPSAAAEEEQSLKRTPTSAFENANRLYEQGQYEQAAVAYSEIVKSSKVSAALFFNLGNAHFKSGQLGRAIFNYKLAEQLDPRDPDIRANLRFVRSVVMGGAPPTPALWKRIVSRLNLNEWTILAAVAVWLFFGCQIARQLSLSPVLRKRHFTFVPALLLVLSLTGLGLAWYGAVRPRVAVIQPETILHHGPLDESPSLQTLHDGQELAVLDQKDDWLQVSGAARGTGWIRRDQVVLLP